MLKTVSQQVQQPVENLQILQVRSAIWDSCLGIAAPDTVCTPAAIPGFKVIVNDGPKDKIGRLQRDTWPEIRESEREWVYHLSADATQIVQNTTASDLKGQVSSWLNNPETKLKPLDDTVVFQMIGVSYVLSSDTTITLTTDGKVTYEILDYSSRDQPTSETISWQIPLEEVASFEALLKQQRFSNFDRMSYGNEDQFFSSEGNVTVRTSDAIMRINARESDLPVGLQPILEAWSKFAY